MSDDPNIYGAIGRLEGKVDLLLSLQSRMTAIEERQNDADNWRAGQEASKQTTKDNRALIVSLVALAASAYGQLKGLIP